MYLQSQTKVQQKYICHLSVNCCCMKFCNKATVIGRNPGVDCRYDCQSDHSQVALQAASTPLEWLRAHLMVVSACSSREEAATSCVVPNKFLIIQSHDWGICWFATIVIKVNAYIFMVVSIIKIPHSTWCNEDIQMVFCLSPGTDLDHNVLSSFVIRQDYTVHRCCASFLHLLLFSHYIFLLCFSFNSFSMILDTECKPEQCSFILITTWNHANTQLSHWRADWSVRRSWVVSVFAQWRALVIFLDVQMASQEIQCISHSRGYRQRQSCPIKAFFHLVKNSNHKQWRRQHKMGVLLNYGQWQEENES